MSARSTHGRGPADAVRYAISVYGCPLEEIAAVCRHAEELGFARAWVGDHVVVPLDHRTPYPYAGPTVVTETAPYQLDVWVTVGAILAATTTLEVATGIAVLALRHPLVQARAAVTAHVASGGRFALGCGVGWLREEFEALDIGWARRGRRFDEALDVLELAFRGGPFEHDGDFYRFPAVEIAPEPVEIPLVLGGSSDPALARGARRGSGFILGGEPVAEAAAKRSRLLELRRHLGRTEDFAVHVWFVGAPTRRGMAPYLEAGFADVIVPYEVYAAGTRTHDDRRRALEGVARELGLA